MIDEELQAIIAGAKDRVVREPEWRCPTCGRESSAPPCVSCNAAAGRRRAVLRKLEETIPSRYRWASFESPELAGRVKDAANIAKAKTMVGAPMVALSGPAGAGKTVLATCIMRARVEGGAALNPLFAFAGDLATARQHAKLGDGEAKLIESAECADVLVLDDLGQEADTMWSKALVEIIHHRHANELATIVTTGLDTKTVATRYGDGCARRLFEGGYLAMRKAAP